MAVLLVEYAHDMKWASKYDRDAIRAAFPGSTNTSRGLAEATIITNSHSKSEDALKSAQNMQRVIFQEK